MFANLLQLITGKPSQDFNRSFIKDVTVREKRNRRVEKLLIICWVLIAFKCVFVVWAIQHWAIPFNPLWIVAPTIAMALLCTLIYWKR